MSIREPAIRKAEVCIRIAAKMDERWILPRGKIGANPIEDKALELMYLDDRALSVLESVVNLDERALSAVRHAMGMSKRVVEGPKAPAPCGRCGGTGNIGFLSTVRCPTCG